MISRLTGQEERSISLFQDKYVTAAQSDLNQPNSTGSSNQIRLQL